MWIPVMSVEVYCFKENQVEKLNCPLQHNSNCPCEWLHKHAIFENSYKHTRKEQDLKQLKLQLQLHSLNLSMVMIAEGEKRFANIFLLQRLDGNN